MNDQEYKKLEQRIDWLESDMKWLWVCLVGANALICWLICS